MYSSFSLNEILYRLRTGHFPLYANQRENHFCWYSRTFAAIFCAELILYQFRFNRCSVLNMFLNGLPSWWSDPAKDSFLIRTSVATKCWTTTVGASSFFTFWFFHFNVEWEAQPTSQPYAIWKRYDTNTDVLNNKKHLDEPPAQSSANSSFTKNTPNLLELLQTGNSGPWRKVSFLNTK